MYKTLETTTSKVSDTVVLTVTVPVGEEEALNTAASKCWKRAHRNSRKPVTQNGQETLARGTGVQHRQSIRRTVEDAEAYIRASKLADDEELRRRLNAKAQELLRSLIEPIVIEPIPSKSVVITADGGGKKVRPPRAPKIRQDGVSTRPIAPEVGKSGDDADWESCEEDLVGKSDKVQKQKVVPAKKAKPNARKRKQLRHTKAMVTNAAPEEERDPPCTQTPLGTPGPEQPAWLNAILEHPEWFDADDLDFMIQEAAAGESENFDMGVKWLARGSPPDIAGEDHRARKT